MILFLDIDGVLHPTGPSNGDKGVLCHLHRFEAVMHDFPNWKIVISSSWREEFSLETIQGFFTPNIASRIVGTTPILSSSRYVREEEIRQYLYSTGQQSATWVALDDAIYEFFDKSNLILCHPEIGLDEVAAEKLRTALTQKSTKC